MKLQKFDDILKLNEVECPSFSTRHPSGLNRRFIVFKLYKKNNECIGEARMSIHNVLAKDGQWELSMITNIESAEIRVSFDNASSYEINIFAKLSEIKLVNEILDSSWSIM